VVHELLDIIDETDRVIGCLTRAEIHRTERLHRAVHMLLFNGQGKLFLQQRAASKDMYPGCWDSSAAGHVDSGEDYLSCAVRELEEELGVLLPASDFTEFWQQAPSEHNGFERQRFYAVITDHPITPCPREIADFRWLTPAEMDSWVASDDNALTLDLKLAWPVYCARPHPLQSS